MGKVSLTAVVVWSLVGLAGCSAIAGLDSIQEQSCAPNCGDAGMNPPTDSSTQESSQADSMLGGDTSTIDDSGMTQDSGPMMSDTGGGGQDSGVVDSGSGMDVDMNPFDSGCGDLNTTAHCSACPDTCAAASSSVTSAQCCDGTTCPGSTNGQNNSCVYTCATGYLDCNGPAGTNPPNIDGCECHVPGATQSQCCAGNCPIAHNNGLNQVSSNFYDCEPANSYDEQLAIDACTAMVGAGNAGQCTGGQCISPDGGTDGDLVICSTGSSTDCVCWTYAGPNVGYFHNPNMPPGTGDMNCFCASSLAGDTKYH